MKGKKKKTSPDQRIRIAWIAFGCLWMILAIYFLCLSCSSEMPSFDQLENPSSIQSSEVLSEDGEILGFIGFENRSDVGFNEISPNVINALVATEDARFYEHSGIDMRSLGRVFFKTIVGRNSGSGGGSTVSQQLAKNLFTLEGRAKASSKLGIVKYKFMEWIVAVKLERTYSKQEILAMYLNTVDYGSNSFGIKTAAKTFFNKSPKDLSINEAAVLVGLLKAPTAYSPKLHPEKSTARRNVVLSQMVHYGYLDQDEYDSLSQEPIKLTYAPPSHNEGLATYLREYVRSYMKEWCKTHTKTDENGHEVPYDVHKDGLRIYTTIDSRLQKYAEAAALEHLSSPEGQQAFDKELKRRNGNPFVRLSDEQQEKLLVQAMKNSDRYYQLKQNGMSDSEIRKNFKEPVDMTVFAYDYKNRKTTVRDTTLTPWDSLIYYKKFLNVGMVSIEPGSGKVKAYVGGINYRYFKYDNVLSHRQVGSTFKPFVYTMALQDLGMYPCTEVPNSEVCFELGYGQPDWCPKNSSHDREGEMVTLKWALANSINWVSAYIMKQGSPEQVVRIASSMGIGSDPKTKLEAVPSLCVGTAEVTVMEMAGAMATFANNGEYAKPIFITKICDNKGVVLDQYTTERQTAINPTTAYLMIQMMKGVVHSGTGTRLNYKYKLNEYSTEIAGKTGTTQNNSDCWFMGITPKLVTAVWTGGEMRSIHFTNMAYGQGAALALPIFGYFMKRVYQDPQFSYIKDAHFSIPEDFVEPDCDAFDNEIQNEGFVYEF
ncbi:MAG: penicillin-binding protein [Bacteroidales bacterium]|nr:penicillin-binding protein [Bacteroidales bacterium]